MAVAYMRAAGGVMTARSVVTVAYASTAGGGQDAYLSLHWLEILPGKLDATYDHLFVPFSLISAINAASSYGGRVRGRKDDNILSLHKEMQVYWITWLGSRSLPRLSMRSLERLLAWFARPSYVSLSLLIYLHSRQPKGTEYTLLGLKQTVPRLCLHVV